ncbi:MAG TPA: type II toxin-antitoxin system prevent-host-death family antitoxin [Galbitalea sp.]|nr:type II toxin-antitoxin system prevent-host-death family antitoxin [Galbitalea sp.]
MSGRVISRQPAHLAKIPRADSPLHRVLQWYGVKYYSPEATVTGITATEARKTLFGLIQRVNDGHTAIEVVSRHGNAVILSKMTTTR